MKVTYTYKFTSKPVDEERQSLINKLYDGDEKRYEAVIDYGRSKAVRWDDVLTTAQTLPEYENLAYKQIEAHLGYLPHYNILVAHESYIKALLKQLRAGQMSYEEYEQQLKTHVRHIRNDDMNKFYWTSGMTCTSKNEVDYNAYMPQFAEKAQQRLVQFFGFLPKLDYRYSAEKFIREVVAQDSFHDDMLWQEMECKAFTIINYRMVLAEHGVEAANASPLLGLRPRL